jgi:hypothetical protein
MAIKNSALHDIRALLFIMYVEFSKLYGIQLRIDLGKHIADDWAEDQQNSNNDYRN